VTYVYSDSLTSHSKSLAYSVTLVKSSLSKSTSSGQSVTQIMDTLQYTPATNLLDHVLRITHDCSDRLFVGFMELIHRHSCRTEHRWWVLAINSLLFVTLWQATSIYHIQTIVINDPAVCLSITQLHCANTAEWIGVLLRVETWGPRERCIR